MRIDFRRGVKLDSKTDLLVIFVETINLKRSTRKKSGPLSLADINDKTKGQISKALAARDYDPQAGTAASFNLLDGNLPRTLLLLGVKGSKRTLHDHCAIFRKYGVALATDARRIKAKRIVVLSELKQPIDEDGVCAFIEGVKFFGYTFNRYKNKQAKTKKPQNSISEITFGAGFNINLQLKARTEALLDGTFYARDLINTPAQDCNPKYLVNCAKEIAKKNKLKIEVFDRVRLKKMGAGGLIGVSQGSATGAYLIKMTYRPRASKKPPAIAIVGKGITFDSGGLSIKPGEGLMTMKCDMSGAAAVLGCMSVISKLKPAVEVRAYIPTCENMIGPSAMRPGDVIRALNGTTVEVLNTDAEGRLVLMDALSMCVKDGADEIIDLATLTGACVVALGTSYAGILSSSNALTKSLKEIGEKAGERLWELPLAPEYREHLNSSVADLRNIGRGGRGGGTITAALFLEKFVANTPWAHLDIAGVAFADAANGHIAAGGTGFGVRILGNYLANAK